MGVEGGSAASQGARGDVDFRELARQVSVETKLLAACGLDDDAIDRLEVRAAELGSNPLDLAIAAGTVDEVDFLLALARHLGARYAAEPPPPMAGSDAAEAFRLRSYRAAAGGEAYLRVIAPDARLAALMLARYDAATRDRFVLTTRQALLDRLVAADGPAIARRARTRLPPRFSAASAPAMPAARAWSSRGRLLLVGTVLLLAALWLALAWFDPLVAVALPPMLMAPIFLVGATATLTAVVESQRPVRGPPVLPPARLPRYSVLVPLYREGAIVGQLVERLGALDYPPDRLEILLIVEADDRETIDALGRLDMPATMQRLTLPDGQPRTKPRALNAALDFASGDLLVVYDAEDQPDPDQLRRAADAFAEADSRTVCLQARIAIANSADCWLTRRFAIEYAALFDCIKAGSARLGWPVPLGGTSNHFRSTILRRIGGWDAWNVTEDADLGIRLARFGYLVDDLASTTWEEAPNRLGNWLNQRTRWLKGWFQTVLVHARQPRQLIGELGGFEALVLAAIAFSTLVGALLYPFFAGAVILRLTSGIPLGAGPGWLILADAIILFSFGVVLILESVPALLALERRRARHLAPFIVLAPVTQLLVTVAAWRALVDLVVKPFHWHKTRHGLARRSGGISALD